MRLFLLAIVAALLSGCSTSFSTLRQDEAASQVIYQVDEAQAFQIAFSSLGRVLPGYEITDIDGPVKGYTATFRFVLDTYTQQVMVIPAVGRGTGGDPVRGYYFEVSGRGTSLQGRAKNVELFETVSGAAKSTGKGITATAVASAPYTGAKWKQGDANRVAPPSSSANDALDQIERLKVLRDRGAITDSEFEKKKTELLGRI